MDRILKILKKENGPRASSAPALELNTIIFKHVYWYMQQISGERLQDHWSSGLTVGIAPTDAGDTLLDQDIQEHTDTIIVTNAGDSIGKLL